MKRILGLVCVGLLAALPAAARVESSGDATAEITICLQQALNAAKRIKEPDLRDEAIQYIALAQACAGDVSDARRTIEGCQDAETVAAVLAAIGLAQAKAKDAAAKATLTEARRCANRVSEPRTRELLFHAIIETLAAAGQDAEAAEIARSFSDRLDQTQGFLAIARAQLAQGRRKEAMASVAKAAGVNRRSLDVFDMSALEEILKMYLQLDQTTEAAKLAHAIPKGQYARCDALCLLAQHEAKAGKEAARTFAEAFQAARDIEGAGPCRAVHMDESLQDGYQNAVLLLTKAGDYTGGYAAAKKIKALESRSWAVRTVAYYQASAQGAGATTAIATSDNLRLQSAIYLGAALGLLNRRGIEVRSHYGLLLTYE